MAKERVTVICIWQDCFEKYILGKYSQKNVQLFETIRYYISKTRSFRQASHLTLCQQHDIYKRDG